MDVHPPLAKLLITLAGFLAGFDGSFDFKDIGLDYIEPGVPYVAMRMLPAILGVLTVPLMFLTLKATGCKTSTAVMGAVLVTFGRLYTIRFKILLTSLIIIRQCPDHSISLHPSRLTAYFLHCADRVGFLLLHEPT
jgi:dolichyl-phosphate-mannose--protein O-mannosyl transferase